MKPYYSLSDFPDRKSAGKNFVAVCPKCGTPHLSISKAKGVYHCFYAGCNFNGILTDFCKADRPMFPQYSAGAAGYAPTRSGNRYKTARNDAQSTTGEVPMLPSDYKPLTAEVMQKIKPLTDSPDCTDPDQLAARRYLLDQGISLATAITARIGCLRHYCITKDSENKSEQASNVFPCIAYVNYVDGHPVNAKYRSCSPSPSARQEEGKPTVYSKFWGQDSPTALRPLQHRLPQSAARGGRNHSAGHRGGRRKRHAGAGRSRLPICHQRTVRSRKRLGQILRSVSPMAGTGGPHRGLR